MGPKLRAQTPLHMAPTLSGRISVRKPERVSKFTASAHASIAAEKGPVLKVLCIVEVWSLQQQPSLAITDQTCVFLRVLRLPGNGAQRDVDRALGTQAIIRSNENAANHDRVIVLIYEMALREHPT